MVGNLLKSGLNIDSQLFKSALGQKSIKEGIKQTPNIYKARVNKILNKKIEKMLESDLANYAIKESQNKLYNWQNT